MMTMKMNPTEILDYVMDCNHIDFCKLSTLYCFTVQCVLYNTYAIWCLYYIIPVLYSKVQCVL